MSYVIAHLDITTWVGLSIGAQHYYVELIIDNPNAKHGTDRIKIERPLTATEAIVMNLEAKAQGYLSRMYKPGEMTQGYNSREDAIAAGIKYFNEHYQGVLYDGDHCSCSAWKKAVVWPEEFTHIVKSMNKLADEFQALNGYECKKDKEAQVERLDKRWYKRYHKLEELCKAHV